jgi:hypothetical protein
MSTPTHPFTPRSCARAAFLVLLFCAVVLLSGCVAAPAGQPPDVVTVLVEVTRLVPETEAPIGTTVATARPAAPSAAPRATHTPMAEPSATMAPSFETPEPPTPDTAGVTEPLYLSPAWPCNPTDGPEVSAVDNWDTASGGLPPLCISGFAPGSEVDLQVTYPDGQSEFLTELMDENGTTMEFWSAEASFPAGAYTFEATQGDLTATGTAEVGAGTGSQKPTPEPQNSDPSIEVYPIGESGRDFEVTLSGFEPYQEVRLRLYAAMDEARTEFHEIDSLFEQMDAQGEATFPLEVTPADSPTSWYALTYFLEDGTPIYAEFQVE